MQMSIGLINRKRLFLSLLCTLKISIIAQYVSHSCAIIIQY